MQGLIPEENLPTASLTDLSPLANQDISKGLVKPIFIGVTGGTASGKTSFCRRLGETLKEDITIISLDNFYRGLS